MSEREVRVVRIGKVEKHPNADSLSITQVHGGYPVVFKTGSFEEGDLATYVPVEMFVPVSHPYFSWLNKGEDYHRVRAVRLRGIFSMGLLVPAPEGTAEGQEVSSVLGIKTYLCSKPDAYAVRAKPVPSRTARTYAHKRAMDGAIATAAMWVGWIWYGEEHSVVLPIVGTAMIVAAVATLIDNYQRHHRRPSIPYYDIEALRHFRNAIAPGETVVIQEKLHGSNICLHHTGKKLHVRSRTKFREDRNDKFWQAARAYNLETKLKKYPGYTFFGEIVGAGIQDLDYGIDGVELAIFDIRKPDGHYMDWVDMWETCRELDLPMAPTLYIGPWREDLVALAEGQSTVPGARHVREGFVVRTVSEQLARGCGRVILKMHGQGYLLR